MEPLPRSAFAVRPSWRVVLAFSSLGLLVALQTGCNHRRSSLRPRFAAPASISQGCATCGDARGSSLSQGCASCGGAGGSSVRQSEPMFSDPTIINEAPRPFGDSELGEPAPGDPEVIPSSRSRAPSGGTSEPFLDPRTPGSSDDGLPPEATGEPETRYRPPVTPPSTRESRPITPTKSSSVPDSLFDGGPALEPPQEAAARPSKRVIAPTRRPVYRRDLEARVNDPSDLFSPPRADRPWRYIVLHHSAHAEGGLAQIDHDHRERISSIGCGYHFVVGNGSESPDGQIEVARRWSEQKGGQHCRDSRVADINEYGIGICLIGNLDDADASAEQVESTKLLISYLQERYDIPAGNVVTHDVVAKTAAACPGRNFPTQALLGRPKSMARQATFFSK